MLKNKTENQIPIFCVLTSLGKDYVTLTTLYGIKIKVTQIQFKLIIFFLIQV